MHTYGCLGSTDKPFAYWGCSARPALHHLVQLCAICWSKKRKLLLHWPWSSTRLLAGSSVLLDARSRSEWRPGQVASWIVAVMHCASQPMSDSTSEGGRPPQSEYFRLCLQFSPKNLLMNKPGFDLTNKIYVEFGKQASMMFLVQQKVWM